MKNVNLKSLLVGIVVGITLSVTVTAAYASRGNKTIQADYHDIKITVDGAVITPKDADGKVVEPFTYNGTTYLPVRALAGAFGKNVAWDAPSETVIITTPGAGDPSAGKTAVYFETFSPQKTFNNGELTPWSANDRDLLANTYAHGIILRNTTGLPQIAEYPLNSAYSTFSGRLVPMTGNLAANGSYALNIYGDNELLYSSPVFTASSVIYADDFDVDVTSIDVLKLELLTVGTANTGVGLVNGILTVK